MGIREGRPAFPLNEGLQTVIRRLIRIAVISLAGLSVGACGVVKNSEIFQEEFWASSPLKDNTEAELGLAELGKGNLSVAEAHFQKALKANDRDVHALMGLGILYQNTGQMVRAREMYEAVLANRPDAAEQFVVWNTTNTRPVSEIASVNLALLESNAVTSDMAQGAAGHKDKGEVAGAPKVSAMMGRGAAPRVMPASVPVEGGQAPTVMSVLTQEDTNVIERFNTLRMLGDEGLITAEEFATRRQANLGALLPLTAPPPAAGLDRPVPSADQISGRLRAIGRALEMRAMTVGQHANERAMIVDALMPAAPVAVANPGKPPQGLMEAADAVRRLEALQAEGLITSDEYARERSAIERAMQPEPQVRTAAASPAATGPKADAEKMAPAAVGPRPAVHLASYRSQQAANRGWTQLRRAHSGLLGKLSADISQINLGPGKGTFFRLKAGPLNSRGAAESLCGRLKSRRQYCEPTFMGG